MKNGLKAWLEAQYRRYDRLMDKQGFTIVLSICVLVIVLSAVYTAKLRDTLENPVLSGDEREIGEVLASEDETLAQARQWVVSQPLPTASPQATQAPLALLPPLSGAVIRSFSLTKPAYFPAIRAYEAHTGVDIAADYGALVVACEKGEVIEVSDTPDKGLCVALRHADGLISRCCGLSEAPYVRVGDRVDRGQTLGHVGNGVLTEAEDGAHLHFELRLGGELVDPEAYLSDFSSQGG